MVILGFPMGSIHEAETGGVEPIYLYIPAVYFELVYSFHVFFIYGSKFRSHIYIVAKKKNIQSISSKLRSMGLMHLKVNHYICDFKFQICICHDRVDNYIVEQLIS